MLGVGTARANPLGYAYNTALTGDTLSVFDTESDEVKKIIPLSGRATFGFFQAGAVAVSPDGHRVFALFQETPDEETVRCSVFIVDTAGHRVMPEIRLPVVEGELFCNSNGPLLVASPNGARLYARTEGNLSVINVESGTVISNLPADEGNSLAIAPDGARLYVIPSADPTISGGPSMLVIDTNSGDVVSTIALPLGASILESAVGVGSQTVVSADGTKVLVGVGAPNDFIIVNTVTETVKGPNLGGDRIVKKLVLSGDGTRAYAVTAHGELTDVEIVAFDAESLAVIGRVSLGDLQFADFLDAPDRRALYVSGGLPQARGALLSRFVAVIDLAELRERARIDIGNFSLLEESAVSFRGDMLYLPLFLIGRGNGRIVRLDVTGLRGSIDLGAFSPREVIVTEDGRKAYVRGEGAGFVGRVPVRVVDFERNSVTEVPSLGAAFLGIALGGRCDRSLGCFCTADADCDDADPCTADLCRAAIECTNTTFGCFPGVLCRFQERATEPCRQDLRRLGAPDAGERELDIIGRLSTRAREKISAAQAAAERGGQARARALLRGARRDVRKALAVAVRLLVRGPSVLCPGELILEQLQRLRRLKALTREVTCEGVPRA